MDILENTKPKCRVRLHDNHRSGRGIYPRSSVQGSFKLAARRRAGINPSSRPVIVSFLAKLTNFFLTKAQPQWPNSRALRRRAICSLKRRQPYCSLENTDGHGPPNGGRKRSTDACYKHDPPMEGQKEMAKLQLMLTAGDARSQSQAPP